MDTFTHYKLVPQSGNRKIGPIVAIYAPFSTCPTSCLLNRAGCYAQGRIEGIIERWRALSSIFDICRELDNLPAQLVRYGVTGDLPGNGEEIKHEEIDRLFRSLSRHTAIVYTHYREKPLAEALTLAAISGITLNVSCDTLSEAEKYQKLGFPTVVTVPLSFKERKGIVICPAQSQKGTTCATCRLCASERNSTIAFIAHGPNRLALSKRLEAFNAICHTSP